MAVGPSGNLSRRTSTIVNTSSICPWRRLPRAKIWRWSSGSARFQGYWVKNQVVTQAASVGAMDILEFFLENDNTSLQHKIQAENAARRVTTGHRIHWSSEAMEAAVKNGHNNVMWWLRQHLPTLRYDMNKIPDHAVRRGDIALAEWLLSHGSVWPRHGHGWCVAHDVAAQGRLDVLKWLDTKEQVQGHAGLVLVAAEKGYLVIIRWLLDHDAQSSNQHRLTDLGGEAGLAVHTAVVNGHLGVAKYLRARAQIPASALQRTIESLERVGRIRSLTRQLGGLVSVSSVSANTLVEAGKNGHLATVQWLFIEYYGDRKAKTCGGGNQSNEHTSTDSTALVAAASQGHLKVLVLLQTLEIATGVSTRKRLRDGTTKDANQICMTSAMDNAAANGFLEVVKWLHETRTEGCTTHAMDGAAAGGHCEVVHWLRIHRSEGCTKAALDGAAKNGHLGVVKWLHHNTSAGCTTLAMDEAAANGHLDVVIWLHAHRREGCTVAALDEAASLERRDMAST